MLSTYASWRHCHPTFFRQIFVGTWQQNNLLQIVGLALSFLYIISWNYDAQSGFCVILELKTRLKGRLTNKSSHSLVTATNTKLSFNSDESDGYSASGGSSWTTNEMISSEHNHGFHPQGIWPWYLSLHIQHQYLTVFAMQLHQGSTAIKILLSHDQDLVSSVRKAVIKQLVDLRFIAQMKKLFL